MLKVNTIFYDITELCLLDKGTGIQRVTRAILDVLRNSPPVGWQVLAVRGDPMTGEYRHAVSYEQLLNGSSANRNDDPLIFPKSGDIFLSVDLTYNITKSLKDKLAQMRSSGVGVYFVVHDLIPIRYPQWFTGANGWFEGNHYLDLFRFWIECVSSEADGLVCVSQAVQHDVALWIKENPPATGRVPKLGFFHHGSDIGASAPSKGLPENASTLMQVLAATPSLLMVGTLEPRKGHALALDAVEKLWSLGVQVNLVIVGKPGWKIETLMQRIEMHPELNRRLFWLNGISDEFLEAIYRESFALLALSEAEGFGLPLVEAGHFKLPVIARDIEVFREVTGNQATFFSGENGEELAELLVSVLDARRRGEALALGNMKVQSWRDSVRQLFETLENMSGTKFLWSQ